MRRIHPTALIIFLMLTLLTPLSAYGKSPEAAFRELHESRIKYTGDAFVYHAWKGNRAVVELFLTAGMPPNLTDERGYTALMGAASGGHLDIVRVLMNEGANANTKDREFGMTALLDAVISGQTEVVRTLLDKGADVDATDKDGRTALMLATGDRPDAPICYEGRKILVGGTERHILDGGNPDIVRVLVDAKAHANKSDKDGRTPLMLAAYGSQIENIRVLLDAGADPNVKSRSHGDAAKAFFGNGPSFRIGDGWTPLMYAVLRGAIEVVQALLDAGANPNIADDNGFTPLMFAATRRGCHAVVAVKLLLEAGADRNVKDENGNTALTYAMDAENEDAVQLLLEADAEYFDNEMSLSAAQTETDCLERVDEGCGLDSYTIASRIFRYERDLALDPYLFFFRKSCLLRGGLFHDTLRYAPSPKGIVVVPDHMLLPEFRIPEIMVPEK